MIQIFGHTYRRVLDASGVEQHEAIQCDDRKYVAMSFFDYLSRTPNAHVNLPKGVVPQRGFTHLDLSLAQHEMMDVSILGAFAGIGELEQLSNFPDDTNDVLDLLLLREFEEFNLTGDSGGDAYFLSHIDSHLSLATALTAAFGALSDAGRATLGYAGILAIAEIYKKSCRAARA